MSSFLAKMNKITEKITKLKTYQGSSFAILSVYLSSKDTKVPHQSFYLTLLHSLIHQNLSAEEQKFWQGDIAKIEEYLHEFSSGMEARSVVFFSAGENLWEVLEFGFFLPPQVKRLNPPYLKPIEEALKTYQKYLVLLVDREKARIFTVHLGEIEEHKDIFDGEIPQRVKAKTINLGRTDKIMRDIEGHVHRHLQLIVQATKEFITGKNIHFIIIGGHHELLPKLKKHLQYPLNKMVLGEFVTELNIPLSDILEHSKTVAARINRRLSKKV